MTLSKTTTFTLRFLTLTSNNEEKMYISINLNELSLIQRILFKDLIGSL
jgi:hypothetical protein